MKDANMTIHDISRVSMATKTLPPMYFYTRRNSTFSIDDYWKEQMIIGIPNFL